MLHAFIIGSILATAFAIPPILLGIFCPCFRETFIYKEYIGPILEETPCGAHIKRDKMEERARKEREMASQHILVGQPGMQPVLMQPVIGGNGGRVERHERKI